VADCLAADARRAGLEVELSPALPDRPNLLVRLAPRGRIRQRILLAPHLDTVGGEEVGGSLFIPRVQRGRMYGRGACDTKASVAAMMTALLELAGTKWRPQTTEVLFVGLVDEEYGQEGSRALLRQGYKADLAIVGEPTRLQVVTAHKGHLWLQLTTHGRSAHGARPELGRNAIHLMAQIVHGLMTRYAATLRRRRHPLLGHPTVNIGSIRGGGPPNIVPARCSLVIDRRVLPGETDASVIRELRRWLKQHRMAVKLARMKAAPCRPLATDPNNPWIRLFLRCAHRRTVGGVDFFSDAGVLAQGGIPSIVFGPGNIAQAHKPDEWIDLRQIEQAAAILRRFLEALP
jgi:acetylornithine deacetylase/succinyl-diaminopimelate desuccinylase-like protein